MLKPSTRLNGIGEYYFSAKLREIEELNSKGKDIISLGIGSPDLPPHPEVIRILNEESVKTGSHAYQSYKGIPRLRRAFSDWYSKYYGVGLDPDTEILPLMGSKEGIMHICMAYLNSGDTALVPNPGYPTYASAVKLAGAQVVYYDLDEKNNYEPDFESIERQLEPNTRIMFVNYPHMPTGATATVSLFEKIIAFAHKHGILIVHDNPYSFILNETPASILAVPGARDVAMELNSLSKSHNMAGWRIGMLAGHSEHINNVLRFKSNMDSGMFMPLQLAAVKALELDHAWYKDLNAQYTSRRERVFDLLDSLGCTYSTSQSGLFVWAKSAGFQDGYALSDDVLYNKQVFITPGGVFGSAGDAYIRVSLCVAEEKIEQAIKRIIH